MRKKSILALILMLVLSIGCTVSAFAEEEEDYTVLGLYKEQGYINEYFGYQIDLPAEFVLESRATVNLNNEDVIESSNKETTLSMLKALVNLSYTTGFTAMTNEDYLCVTLQSPGIMNDHWASEDEIAENTFVNVMDELEAMNEEEGITVEQINGQVDYLDHFIDGKHSCCLYDCLLNGMPYYGVQIYVVSDDSKYLSIIDIQSFNPDHIEAICDCFTELD